MSSRFDFLAKRGKFSAIMKKQIVNETIDGSIKSIIQLKTLDSSLEFAQMFDALNDCPSDFQGKLIQVLNSIGETIKVSPVEVFNIVLCANEEDDTRKKLYNWWRGLFEILSKCEIPDDRKSEYDEKVDALIAEISKAGDNAQVNESEEVGYEQADKEDEDVMLKEMEFAISKIGEIANKVQDLINFVNPYCESNEVINTMKNESKSRQARRDAMFDKIESLGYVINEAPYGWAVELGDELKKEYEEKMGGIKSYLPDYLKLDIWSSAISVRHPREDMRGFFFDNGDGSIGYPRAFNHWLNCPARKELRERFDIENLEDGANCPDGSCGKGGVWLNESVLDVKEGDVVDWFDPEDQRVYHGFTVTKVFAKNGMAEISNDDEGVFVVGINELEPGGEPMVESSDVGLDMIEKDYVLGFISKQGAIRKLDALFHGDEIKTNEEIANFTTLKYEYEDLVADAIEGMLDASDVIEFLVDRELMDYDEATEYVEEELDLQSDYDESKEVTNEGDDWVSMDSLIGTSSEDNEVELDDEEEQKFLVGSDVYYTDPDNDISSGVYTVDDYDGEIYYLVHRDEDGTVDKNVEAFEHELKPANGVDESTPVTVSADTVWDILKITDDATNLKELIQSKVRTEEEIMEAIEAHFGDKPVTQDMLIDLFGNQFKDFIDNDLGINGDVWEKTGAFEDMDKSINESDDMDELDDKLSDVCVKYKDAIHKALDTLNEFNDATSEYAPTCGHEINEAINNLIDVVDWVDAGADYGFTAEAIDADKGEPTPDEVKGGETKKFKTDDGEVKSLDNAGKKVVTEMTIEQEINDVHQLANLLWGQGRSNLEELINSEVDDDAILAEIENYEIKNLTGINDLLAYGFESLLERLGCDMEEYEDNGEIILG